MLLLTLMMMDRDDLGAQMDRDLRMLGTSRSRIVQYWSLGAGLALAGDLFGVTSNLLSSSPEGVKAAARRANVDAYYPIDGRKKYVDDELGFELVYPSSWLGDQAVYLARVDRRATPLDADSVLRAAQRRTKVGPDAVAAFGPPKGSAEENVSVFRSRLEPGFTLRGTLGPPDKAAQRLLDEVIAPASSGKTAQLLDARETSVGYVFEYVLRRVDGSVFHNLAVIAPRRGNELFTFTVLCKEENWPQREAFFRDMAGSFRLTIT